MARPKKPKPTPKYSWIMSGNYVYCYKHPWGGQDVAKLWESAKSSDFHDAELAKATREINAILGRLERNNRSDDRKLSFVEFQNRYLLVWAKYGVVGPFDEPATIMKALKLKAK